MKINNKGDDLDDMQKMIKKEIMVPESTSDGGASDVGDNGGWHDQSFALYGVGKQGNVIANKKQLFELH